MAEKHDVLSKVTALIVEQCEEQVPSLPLDGHTPFEELGIDWLAHAELIMRLEEEFSLIISDEEAEGLVNLQAVVQYLEQKKSAA
jgi:acyl carrier protein